MVDVNAIREDVEMAARSPEMARHVALDHVPELLDIVERVRRLAAEWGRLGTYNLPSAPYAHGFAAALRKALGGEADRDDD